MLWAGTPRRWEFLTCALSINDHPGGESRLDTDETRRSEPFLPSHISLLYSFLRGYIREGPNHFVLETAQTSGVYPQTTEEKGQEESRVQNVQCCPGRRAEPAARLAASPLPQFSPTPFTHTFLLLLQAVLLTLSSCSKSEGDTQQTTAARRAIPALPQSTPKRPADAPFQQPSLSVKKRSKGPNIWPWGLSPSGAQRNRVPLMDPGWKGQMKGLGLMGTKPK